MPRSNRFRYDTPLHDLHFDEWSDEVRIGPRTARPGSGGHRSRKRWRAPGARFQRPFWGQTAPLPLLPFEPALALHCACRREEARDIEPEAEAEFFTMPSAVTIDVNFRPPFSLDPKTPQGSLALRNAPALPNGGIYVVMDPRNPAKPWYVGQTTTSVSRYLAKRWDEARRLGALRCCTEPLTVHAAEVKSTPPPSLAFSREKVLRLVEGALVSMWSGFGRTRQGTSGSKLQGNIPTSNERDRHFVIGAPVATPKATIRFSSLPAPVEPGWGGPHATWNPKATTLTVQSSDPGPDAPAVRKRLRAIQAAGFEVEPFAFT
jgi:hypothetical protein